MNFMAYYAQVRERLAPHGYTEATVPADMAGRLLVALERAEPWGRLFVAMADAEAAADAGKREGLVNAAAAWVREQVQEGGKPCYLMLVFPFEHTVPEAAAEAIKVLRQEGAERRWGVIPWIADLEVELIDQHTGHPKVGPELAQALTEVPRGAAEQIWRRATGPKIGVRSPLLGNLGYLPATRLIMASTFAWYIWVLLAGGGGGLDVLGGPGIDELRHWGANDGRLVLIGGEQWRLLTYIWLHGGLLHLGFNMWAFWSAGRHVELLYGSGRMAFIYVAAGVAGGIASAVFRSGFAVSVGASGSVLGMMGALVYWAMAMPGRRLHWREMLGPVGINLLYGFFWRGIDQHAHIGGFIGGFLMAFVAGIPGERKAWRLVAMAMTGLLMGALLAGLLPLPHLAG